MIRYDDYSGPSQDTLERTPLYKWHKFLATSTVNACGAPSHQRTLLYKDRFFLSEVVYLLEGDYCINHQCFYCTGFIYIMPWLQICDIDSREATCLLSTSFHAISLNVLKVLWFTNNKISQEVDGNDYCVWENSDIVHMKTIHMSKYGSQKYGRRLDVDKLSYAPMNI